MQAHIENRQTVAAQPFTANPQPKVVKLVGMRQAIAVRMQRSFQTVPHVFFDIQVDVKNIEHLRAAIKARGERLSLTAVLVKTYTWTLLRHPKLNATLEDDTLKLWPIANIGIAVALDDGLIVPVIKEAERHSLQGLQMAADDLIERSRSGRLRPGDLTDGTFTISNLGMYGVDRFTAIINPPQVAILAVGRMMPQFAPDERGQPVLQSAIALTLSADHRVVDGADAALFLADLRSALEAPALMLW